MKKPTLIEVNSDNGEFSHWALINSDNGEKLWSENPEECKAMGYPVSDSKNKAQLDEIEGLKIDRSNIIVEKNQTICDLMDEVEGLKDTVRIKEHKNKTLQKNISDLQSELDNLKIESSHEIADLVKTQQETEKQLDEYCHKIEGYVEHNNQLQSRISELEKGNEWISVEDRLPLATESGEWDGKRSDIYLGKYKDGTYCLFRIYTGFLDGSDFTEYYDENDNSINTPVYYKSIT